MMYLLIAIIVLWVICGYFSFGYNLAYFQKKYSLIAEEEWRNDLLFSWFDFFFGPISLLECFLRGSTDYGRMYKNPHKNVKG